jgi:hypothetical protein
VTLIAEAVACAIMLTGLPPAEGLPAWEERSPALAEIAGRRVVAVYIAPIQTIVSPRRWPLLVHEATHFLQHEAGLPFDEAEAYRAQAQAWGCIEGRTVTPPRPARPDR